MRNLEAPDILHVRDALLYWYDGCARELPWRGASDPYAIWVSEVMCQQTRVETVRDYYARWMVRFPTVAALAEADADDVMALWAGLGYYRRARALHAGAQAVVATHGGEVPATYEELLTLPGVGDYTAGAIASIAFGVAVPAVDGNVNRVLSRLFAIGGAPQKSPFKTAVRKAAGDLVHPERPGDFNQALMELGATVCQPRNPRCNECPLEGRCEARARDAVADFPQRTRRPKPRPQKQEVCVVRHGERYLLRRRNEEGLLSGTWEFPPATAVPLEGDEVGSVEHVFSHVRMTYEVVLVELSETARPGALLGPDDDCRWVGLRDVDTLGISTAMLKVLRLVEAYRAEMAAVKDV